MTDTRDTSIYLVTIVREDTRGRTKDSLVIEMCFLDPERAKHCIDTHTNVLPEQGCSITVTARTMRAIR